MSLSTEARLQAILEGSQAGTWEWNLSNDEFYCNERWASMFGYTLSELAPISKETLVSLCHPNDRPVASTVFREFLSGRSCNYETTLRFRHKNGHWRVIRTRAILTNEIDDEESRWLVGTNEDITGESADKHRLEILAESVPGLIYSFVVPSSGHGYFSYISKKVEDFYGVTCEMAKRDATAVYRAVLPEDRPRLEASLEECSRSLAQWRCDYRVCSASSVNWMRAIATPEEGSDGSITWQGVVINIDKEKQLESALELLSITDELSGLYNRRYLFQRLEELTANSDRYGEKFSVLSLDIDYFKKINDTYGHIEGDNVIRTLGKLIRNRLRKTDIAARTGGEEFVVLMPGTDFFKARTVVEDLRASVVAERFGSAGNIFRVSFSAGLVSYPEHATSPRLLMSRCDQLLYKAKKQGRNRIVIAE